MKIKSGTKVFLLILSFLIVISFTIIGCQEEQEQLPQPSPTMISSTLVPNVPLDVYLYARQDDLTTIPAEMLNMPEDVSVESLAIWGVADEDELVLGIAITLAASDGLFCTARPFGVFLFKVK